MKFPRIEPRQAVAVFAAMASIAFAFAGVARIRSLLSAPSVPEHSAAWAGASASLPPGPAGALCRNARAVDSVDRARLVAIAWERSPYAPLPVDFSGTDAWPPCLVASSFLSAADARRIADMGYARVATNEFATAWSRAGTSPAPSPAPRVSPAREAPGVFAVMALLLGVWLWWRRANGALPSPGAAICAAALFAALSAAALSHTLIAPNGLGVYAGKAKLVMEAGGIPAGFFTSPEYEVFQPSYPPGLALLSLLAYAVSGCCGDWLVQLLVPLAVSLLFLELCGERRRLLSACVAMAVALCPVAVRCASGFYAEPFAALALAMGLRRVWRRGGASGWLVAGASGLFRHECLILVACLWALSSFGRAPERWRCGVAAAALPLLWQAFAYAAGARIYDFDFHSPPDLSRALSALKAAFSCGAFAALALLWSVCGRAGWRVASASTLFLLASCLLMGFNVSPHFAWMVGATMPRVAWTAAVPLAAFAALAEDRRKALCLARSPS